MTMRRRQGTATSLGQEDRDGSESEGEGDTVPLDSINRIQEVMTTATAENAEEDTKRLLEELKAERGLRKDLERQKGILESQVQAVLRDLDSKLQGKGQEIAALNGMNAHLQAQVRELQCSLNANETKVSSLKANPSASPSIAVKELQKRAATLEEELSNGEELLSGLESENESFRKEIEEAHMNIQELDDERRETQIQIKELEKELESAVVEINDLKDSSKRKSELESALQGEINNHLESKTALEKQLSELIMQGESTSKPSESETKAVRDAAFAAARVMELEQELEKMREENESPVKQERSKSSDAGPSKGKVMEDEVLSDSRQERDALERELRSVTEEKKAFESQATNAASDLVLVREDLDVTKQALARKQAEYDSIVRTKEKEIVEVRLEASATRDALIDSQKQVIKLEKRCEALEGDIGEKEDHIAEVENELFQLRQEAEAASEETSSHQIVALQTEVQRLTEDLKTKNARIEKLEKSKLTKDQLDKIKAIKEEKTRLLKENKRLQEQLRLSSSDATASAASVVGGSSDAKELEVLLKDKTYQVEEYEKERQNILQVLEQQGFSVSKHQDSSFNLDSTMDHSDLCISSSLAGIIDNLRKESQKISDSEELKSLEEENVNLLKENRNLRRQLERKKRSANTSMNDSFVLKSASRENTPSGSGNDSRMDIDKENMHACEKDIKKRTASSTLDSAKRDGTKTSTAKKAKPMLAEIK